MHTKTITRISMAVATALLGLTSTTSAMAIAWADMAVGTPLAPTASWFQGVNWAPAVVPTSMDDVTFGGPLAIDNQTVVRFFPGDVGAGYPTAYARSLVADSADSPTPTNSSLLLQTEQPSAPLLGELNVVQGPFDLGTKFGSTVKLMVMDHWSVNHYSTTHPLRVARNGATAEVNINNANLLVSHRIEVGRGFDATTDNRSIGRIEVRGTTSNPSSVSVGDRVEIGVEGGFGTLLLGEFSETTVNGLLAVGSDAPLTADGIIQSTGLATLGSSFIGLSELDIKNELLVGVNAGYGEASLFGDVAIGTDAFGASFVVGRSIVEDTINSNFVRGEGSVDFVGRSLSTGNGFVGIDGGRGSITFAGGGHTIEGDLVVGDLGFNTVIDGYVPSRGLAGIALNSTVTIDDIFIGNNDSFGEFSANPDGDGGAALTADYVSVGERGTGLLRVGGMMDATVNHLEIKLASGPKAYQQGGTVELGSGVEEFARLSVSRLSARGEGNRFVWQSATLELRDGVINDWGTASFIVPELGVFTGAGTADVVAFINQGKMFIGFEPTLPALDDSLVITGNFLNDNGIIQLHASRPDRFGNFDETLIINGDASFNGGIIDLIITDVVGSGYDWHTDIQIGDRFNFFDFNGGLPSLAFPTVNLPLLPSGFSWNTSQLWTDGVIIVVPEPTTLAALVAAASLGLPRRRKL